MRSTELPVGERARRRAGVAVFASLALAAVFAAWTWLSKEAPALNVHQPWQDDPYDVLVSLDFVILPLLVAMGVARVQLCRRYEALPARRLVDVLRVCGAAVGASLVTEVGEWIAVVLGLHSAAWTAATTWQVAVLAVLTVATILAGVLLRHSAHEVSRIADAGAQPDWLADAVNFGFHVARLLGRHGNH